MTQGEAADFVIDRARKLLGVLLGKPGDPGVNPRADMLEALLQYDEAAVEDRTVEQTPGLAAYHARRLAERLQEVLAAVGHIPAELRGAAPPSSALGRWPAMRFLAERALADYEMGGLPPELYVIFDKAPGHDPPGLIEVEDRWGKSVRAGVWVDRQDGTWALVIPHLVGVQRGSSLRDAEMATELGIHALRTKLLRGAGNRLDEYPKDKDDAAVLYQHAECAEEGLLQACEALDEAGRRLGELTRDLKVESEGHEQALARAESAERSNAELRAALGYPPL